MGTPRSVIAGFLTLGNCLNRVARMVGTESPSARDNWDLRVFKRLKSLRLNRTVEPEPHSAPQVESKPERLCLRLRNSRGPIRYSLFPNPTGTRRLEE